MELCAFAPLRLCSFSSFSVFISQFYTLSVYKIRNSNIEIRNNIESRMKSEIRNKHKES